MKGKKADKPASKDPFTEIIMREVAALRERG